MLTSVREKFHGVFAGREARNCVVGGHFQIGTFPKLGHGGVALDVGELESRSEGIGAVVAELFNDFVNLQQLRVDVLHVGA